MSKTLYEYADLESAVDRFTKEWYRWHTELASYSFPHEELIDAAWNLSKLSNVEIPKELLDEP